MESSLASALIKTDDEIDKDLAKGGWRSSVYLLGVEVSERFAIFGAAGNLITYLTDDLHMPMATAAKNINLWGGVTTLLPLFGGFIADTYLGGYTTILIGISTYVVALALLTVSVIIPLEFRIVPFFVALYLVSIAQGGHMPCLLSFGADQFDEGNAQERKAKSDFFNWWSFGSNVGASAGMLIIFYVQENVGWEWGFGIPAVSVAIGLVLFFLGRRKYRKNVPSGSPMTRVAQVFVAAFRKRHVCVSKDGYDSVKCCQYSEVNVIREAQLGGRTLSHTNQFKCLDRAAVVDVLDALSQTRNNWRLCSVTQVEEVKLLLRLVPIWLCCLTYTVVFAQAGTFFTKQGSTMDTTIVHKFHIAPASLQVAVNIAVVLLLPIYDRVFIPVARKFTGFPSGITMLQRIGFGIFLGTLEMVVAALVETRRINIATIHRLLNQPKTTVPMSVWWLIPQYIITGASQAFAVVGLQELFYDQMPDKMRSIGSAAFLSAIGVGSFLSNGVISGVQQVTSRIGDMWLVDNLNRAHLDNYYWFLAGLNSLGLAVFIAVAMFFTYKKVHADASS